MRRLSDAVRERLADTGDPPTAGRVAAAVRAEQRLFGTSEVLDVAETLSAEFAGAGPLEPLLRSPGVTDVLVNGPDDVWTDGADGLARAPVRFPDEASVRRLAQRLTAAAGRRLDDAAPYADARLPGGARLHAVLPPVSPGGTCLSLRLPRRRAFTLDELVAVRTVPPEGATLLRALIDTRAAFLISGGTGTGKTTLLSSLLSLVGSSERLLLVEDSAELRPDHPHVVRLEARPPNIEGAGEVTLRDLVRQALRMRPDRIVVGEVRSREVVDLLAALNTGHEGGCGTLHANAAADVPARLEALACAAGLSREAVHSQLAAALDVVVHLTRDPTDGHRRVAEIRSLHRRPDGLVTAVPAVAFPATGPPIYHEGAEALLHRLAGRPHDRARP
ncbi:TadA family conjugal transfer-associated ATPase [Actinomadura flavalba]|uniref:TadA family conjugal transfer-associated ATPase n=1 Tax=Actinomadura flavalba TaxID=1120938 RepID=UPI0003603DFA|nr:TadA family conjugal transfer-associated ATPase [Actinomadura flavalba]